MHRIGNFILSVLELLYRGGVEEQSDPFFSVLSSHGDTYHRTSDLFSYP